MQRIAATDTFEISWPQAEMANAPWIGDRMHFPGPTAPLAQHMIAGFQEGILSAPTIFANGYEFSLPPTIPDPPAEVVERGLGVWHEEYSPRIRAFCERVRATDFDAMSADELVGALDGLVTDALDHLRLTMVVIKRFMQPTFALLEFLEQELGAEGPMLSGTLIQGFQNATAASGSGLDALVEQARETPELREALSGGTAKLATLPGGAAFLEAFDAYLNEFGWRAETWGSMHVPTWAEEPQAALAMIGRTAAAPERGGGDSASEARDAAIADVEARLPDDKREEFRRLLAATNDHVSVSEDRARWQLSVIGVMRLPLLALGRKLAERGALDEAADVFYLDWEDAKQAALAPAGAETSVRDTALAGKAEFARWQQLAPPPFLGTPPNPAEMPAESIPIVRHFFGLGAPSVEAGVVTGVGASRGTVTGRARVIRQLDESDRLEPGDIMVCVTTAPPWTALFAIAGAVVTDTGGVTSHSAICAREFSIPCVVATQVGTSAIPDGATITVDGEAGTVAILEG